MTLNAECTLVVPVYRNEANIPALLARLADLHSRVPGGIRVLAVVDGSPDRSFERLRDGFAVAPYASRLLLLSRNFGSFAAIRAGLAEVRTPYMAVMAADLQEPSELFESLFAKLRTGDHDVLLASRSGRSDPWFSRFSSGLFWGMYRRLVQPEMPAGGVDVFACNALFRDRLVAFGESNSSLVGQLLWLGFRRAEVPYQRQARELGTSAWTFRRKLRYLADSVFSFSDLPIRVFLAVGGLGLLASVGFAMAVLLARLSGAIEVPGYTATVLAVLFFSALNLFGLGVIGSYVWRGFENTKARPLAVVMQREDFNIESPALPSVDLNAASVFTTGLSA
ncbi:MAG: glycosyltransferase family 2 protein [Pseudomarimonas sp.]